eukprot:Awhi_evm1s13845
MVKPKLKVPNSQLTDEELKRRQQKLKKKTDDHAVRSAAWLGASVVAGVIFFPVAAVTLPVTLGEGISAGRMKHKLKKAESEIENRKSKSLNETVQISNDSLNFTNSDISHSLEHPKSERPTSSTYYDYDSTYTASHHRHDLLYLNEPKSKNSLNADPNIDKLRLDDKLSDNHINLKLSNKGRPVDWEKSTDSANSNLTDFNSASLAEATSIDKDIINTDKLPTYNDAILSKEVKNMYLYKETELDCKPIAPEIKDSITINISAAGATSTSTSSPSYVHSSYACTYDYHIKENENYETSHEAYAGRDLQYKPSYGTSTYQSEFYNTD